MSQKEAVFDLGEEAFSSDHFRMYEFKVKRCPRARPHDWTQVSIVDYATLTDAQLVMLLYLLLQYLRAKHRFLCAYVLLYTLTKLIVTLFVILVYQISLSAFFCTFSSSIFLFSSICRNTISTLYSEVYPITL